FIQIGGQCTSDNLPPQISAIQYAWRSSDLDMQQQIFRVLENNARHVAAINHCKVGIRWVSKTRVGLPNLAMTDLVWRNMRLAGPIQFSEDAKTICREVQRNCGLAPMQEPIREDCSALTSPEDYDAARRLGMPAWQQLAGSDDYVEYCWYSPTARFWTSKAFPKSPEPGYAYPRWVSLALGGIPSTIDPAMILASKTLGASLVELLTTPAELKKAQDEFKERTGGGQGGKKWVGPLLPPDVQPPVDLRWPEYVDTVRGHEWWIPTQPK
ncbi:MAG: amidohydrolase, partial [Acidobacteria bacterium]|nr:amidohydrolase [Acidobacteriota bacterium]